MTATASQETLKLGTLVVSGEIESSLPLEQTDVIAQIAGPVATVSVTQRFGNPFDHPIELVYLFPLPHEAAVVDFELRVGARTIGSRVEETEVARREYESARDSGKRAGLVEERRPNLFSLEIANVQAHETVTATVRYHERLRFDDGEYRFVFPMGLTPKYHADPREAARTDAPVAAAGSAIGTVSVQVSIDAGVPHGDPASPSHAIEVSRLDERRAHVRTLGDNIPNKDFVVRYRVAEDDVRAAAWTASAKGGATLLLTAIPPRLDTSAEPAPREFIFIIDRSGSMSGDPIAQARNALRACIRALGEGDTFTILAFDDIVEWFSESSVAMTEDALRKADRWIAKINARGGTEIERALEAAFSLPRDRARQRYIVFLTDGAVSAERAVLKLVRKKIGDGRLFTFGIGPSVNRALLASMASQGKGTAEFLQANEDIEEALIRFQDRVAYPALQDIEVAWKGTKAWDVYPPRLPDLYHGQPLELTARISGSEKVTAIVTGRRGAEKWRMEIALPAPANDAAIARVWAKARVDALIDAIDSESGGAERGEVIALAIEHRLLTRFTSMVAVDEQSTDGGEAERVRVAVPLPEGLDFGGLLTMAGGMPAFAAAAPMAMGAFFLESAILEEPVDAELEEVELEEGEQAEGDPLRFLARTQNVSGSWGSGEPEIEMTAAAILAFVRRGQTTRSGSYRRQLVKAVKWLLGASASGFAAVARAIALAEIGDAIGDATLSALRSTVRETVDDLRAAALAHAEGPLAKFWKTAMAEPE